jgi:RHS repeat-associated protein
MLILVLIKHLRKDGLRVKKSETGTVTYYLRSSVLGGQVVAEISGSGAFQRGYVYLGSQLVALQQNGIYWVHQDPLVKSKRVTDGSGNTVSTVELDEWGGNTNRNRNDAFQPRRFTNYERDQNASDEAMFRRYNRWWSRFDQPDPYDGSYDLGNPQSFNRYAYVNNDPINLVDPTGLDPRDPPPTTHIDPATGQATSVPGISASVTINISQVFGPGSTLGGDAHAQLLLINFLRFGQQGNPQNYVPPTIKELKESFYKKYKPDVDRCIKEVFRDAYELAMGFGAKETNRGNRFGFVSQLLREQV